MVTGSSKTSAELDKEAAKDLVRAFARLESSDYFRRRFNELWPQVNAAMDEAAANGARVDVRTLVRQVLFTNMLETGAQE